MYFPDIHIKVTHQRVYRERPSQDVGDPTPTAGPFGTRRQRRRVLRQREFTTNTGDLWRKVGRIGGPRVRLYFI